MLHRKGKKENWADLSLLGQEPTFKRETPSYCQINMVCPLTVWVNTFLYHIFIQYLRRDSMSLGRYAELQSPCPRQPLLPTPQVRTIPRSLTNILNPSPQQPL